MNLDSLTIGEAKQLAAMFGGKSERDDGAWTVGEKYLIRTVTMIQVGELVSVHSQELVLSHASWVADTGRFYDALKTGELSEIEPFTGSRIVIGRGAIVDAVVWDHPLPTEQK